MKKIKSFQVMSRQVSIKYTKKTIIDEDGDTLLGDCNQDRAILRVALIDPTSKVKLPTDAIEHNRWHEQLHYMLTSLGYHELSKDEDFVDSMAGLMAQYEATKK